MQLSLRDSIAMLSAGLVAAAAGSKADAQAPVSVPGYDPDTHSFGPGSNYFAWDTALLVYQEPGGRVQAMEPSTDFSVHFEDGSVFTLGLIADSVSGATPNGAVPSDLAQTFITPVKGGGTSSAPSANGGSSGGGDDGGEGDDGGGDDGGGGGGTGSTGGTGGGGGSVSVTGASGGGTVVHVPGGTNVLARQYTVAPNQLPLDKGFRDLREALNLSWTQPLGGISEFGFGAGFSRERDYQAITGNIHAAQNFNADNTTVSLALNIELDTSKPFGGVPTPLTEMSGAWKSPSSRGKTQAGFVVGFTQVVSRRWLMQLNYAFDSQSGYQNDPYRIISVVNPTTGEPLRYLYENRPKRRISQSLLWDNKIDYDPAITDFSIRYFTDDWGISSITADLSERINLGSRFFVEPDVRWYHQTAAKFYRYFLVDGQTLPAFASSDTRLSAFSAVTFGAKLGFDVTQNSELYLSASYYDQMGNGHPADAIGQLRNQNLFAGTKATVFMVGYSWNFD
ncbi:MAG TPA: DUF3570 domain-containing protein [Rhizomicrobium sp.]|nr:DUF3570 domain-containing protein [Rhizomicrobium sp.]